MKPLSIILIGIAILLPAMLAGCTALNGTDTGPDYSPYRVTIEASLQAMLDDPTTPQGIRDSILRIRDGYTNSVPDSPTGGPGE